MNKVILSGNICKDIELKYTTNNIAVVMNAIAVRNDYKNKDNKYDSQFINFVAYRNTAEFISKYAIKGTKILIEGKWNNRKYTRQDGAITYVSEMLVEKVELLSSAKSSTKTSQSSADNLENSAEKVENSNNPFKDFGDEIEIRDEDLPF